jgi:hypothetical protein
MSKDLVRRLTCCILAFNDTWEGCTVVQVRKSNHDAQGAKIIRIGFPSIPDIA